jgi:hypothetical protein
MRERRSKLAQHEIEPWTATFVAGWLGAVEMSNAGLAVAGLETRQAMIRVWMAISAIWIAFWISIATLIVVSGEMTDPGAAQLRLFALIVIAPPVVLLAIGTLFRLGFELFFRRRCDA